MAVSEDNEMNTPTTKRMPGDPIELIMRLRENAADLKIKNPEIASLLREAAEELNNLDWPQSRN